MRELKNRTDFGLRSSAAIMACFSARSAALINDVSSASITTGSRRSMPGGIAPVKPVVVLSSERRDSYGSLILQAAQLLGPPTKFEASKLKVIFMRDELEKPPMFTLPRAYTLTHCDFTANLTLAISNSSYIDKACFGDLWRLISGITSFKVYRCHVCPRLIIFCSGWMSIFGSGVLRDVDPDPVAVLENPIYCHCSRHLLVDWNGLYPCAGSFLFHVYVV